MKVFKAEEYSTRSDLENAVRNSKFALTPEPKPEEEVIIEGGTEDLARLQLSHRSIFWGIKVKDKNRKVEKKPILEKPARGEIFKGGINLEEDKKKKRNNL